MADTDLLPARGVPALALVDSTGIASNGSQTVAQLAARGIRSVCAVDANGVSLSGASAAQLASSGIRAFCPVDENGLAQDAVSTADILRRRGIRPMVLLNNTGVALTGSASVATLAQRGLQAFCPVDEAGNATTMGAVILVSNTTVLDTATIGSNVGTLSVAGGTGTYTFTLTSNPGSLFATAGTNGTQLNVAAALTAGIKPITVQAAGGVPTPISRTINITVVQSPILPVNTVAPVIAGTPQEGQPLTVTSDGTWTGFPAPSYAYQWNRVPVVSAEVSAFLARTSGLDATHTNAYTALIDGLVADGVWTKFDVLHIYATQDSTTAKLNLVSTSFNGTVNGAPTFTADRGYTGVNSSATIYINTGFNPTVGTPKYAQNSAHLSVWNVNNTAADFFPIGMSTANRIAPKSTTSSNTFYQANLTYTGSGNEEVNQPNASGHFIANRSASNAWQGYKNATQQKTGTAVAPALPNVNMYSIAFNNGGTPQGSGQQIAAISAGSSLNSTEVTAFYNRLRTYMTAVGVP